MGIVLNVDDDEGTDPASDSVTKLETELAPTDIGEVPSLNEPILYEPDEAYLDPDEEGSLIGKGGHLRRRVSEKGALLPP